MWTVLNPRHGLQGRVRRRCRPRCKPYTIGPSTVCDGLGLRLDANCQMHPTVPTGRRDAMQLRCAGESNGFQGRPSDVRAGARGREIAALPSTVSAKRVGRVPRGKECEGRCSETLYQRRRGQCALVYGAERRKGSGRRLAQSARSGTEAKRAGEASGFTLARVA